MINENLVLKSESIWGRPGGVFYGFLRDIEENKLPKTIAELGCSDGKYVIPAAMNGFRCLAIDTDVISINGGFDPNIKTSDKNVTGLIKRIEMEKLNDMVDVEIADFLKFSPRVTYSGVFSSAALHYELNKEKSLIDITTAMNRYVSPAGLILIEYIHRSEYTKESRNRYIDAVELEACYQTGWRIIKHDVVEETDAPNPRINRVHKLLWGTFYAQKLDVTK